MMKFKQRIAAILCVVTIGIPYLWIKYKSSSLRHPVVEVYGESLLRTLVLDREFDFNNLDHRHENPKISAAVRRSTSQMDSSKLQIVQARVFSSENRVIVSQKPLAEEPVVGNPWDLWNGMVTETRISPNGTVGGVQVNAILKSLRTSSIVKVGVGFRGSQLKASMFLEGNQRTVFKPKRYERNFIIQGGPYDGFDRHNGEIAAFHLDRLLGFYRAPLVTGRLVNLKSEVLPVTDKALKKTFFSEGNNTCFYGVCYYCNRREPACAEGDIMEGSVTIWLPKGWDLKTWRHPWQRTYSKRKARWETDPTYCTAVKKMVPYDSGPRLASVIDTSIFDFFIGNADRHHYETFQKAGNDGLVLHLDNGKSFGNPDKDEMSILAPLYQCCRILRSTWETLKEFDRRENEPLSEKLKESLSVDPLTPVLTEKHLEAIDRRLHKTIEVIHSCINKYTEKVVLVEI